MLLGGGVGAIVGLLVAAAAVASDAWPLAVVVLPAVAVGAWYGRAAWRRRTWSLGPRALELHRGVLTHRATSVPYERIQQIDVERGPLERMFGLSQLVVRTAAASTDANLYGLSPADADHLRHELLELAGIDDIV